MVGSAAQCLLMLDGISNAANPVRVMDSEPRPIRIAVALLLHILVFIASFSSSALLWGLNIWHGLTFWSSLGLLSLPLLTVGIGEAICSKRRVSGHNSMQGRRWTRIMPLFLLIVAPVAFWFWRDATHLMGDGILILLRTARGEIFSDSSPLSNALLVRIAAHFMGVSTSALPGNGVEIPVVLSSIAYGAMFVGLSWLVWIELVPDVGRQWAGMMLFLLNPTILLFFGYVEFYPLAWVSAILTIWLSLLARRGGVPPWTCIAAFVIAVAAHALLVLYAPMIVIALWRRRLAERHMPAHLMGGIALGLGLLWLCGVDPQRLAGELSGSERFTTLGVSVQEPSVEAYGLFDIFHMIDLANEVFLVMPLALLIPWGWRRLLAQDTTSVLLAPSLATLAAMFVLNPRLGMARDWDLMAFPALSVNLLAIAVLLGLDREKGKNVTGMRRFICLLLGICLARTIGWIELHHNPTRLLPRAEAMASEARLSGTSARRHLRDDLATYFESRGDVAAAYREIREASAIEPTHAWTAFRVADLAHKVRDNATEFDALRRTVELDSSLTAAWGELGRAFLDRGAIDSAEECFQRVLMKSPSDLKAFIGLGIVQLRRGDNEGVMAQARLIADSPQPGRAQALRFLATVLESDGHTREAEEIRRLAATVSPG
jgi:tetratricopeptide (TPR) repeat protein